MSMFINQKYFKSMEAWNTIETSLIEPVSVEEELT